MLSRTGNIDCRTTGQGALCFTDTAADAKLINDIWLFDRYLSSAIVKDNSRTKFNGLIRSRAMLFTDDAGDAFSIGEAGVPVKPGMADFGGMLFLQTEFPDCPGRADLPTECAVELAVSDPGYQPW